MDPISPGAYVETLKEVLKAEVDKMDIYKHKFIESNQLEMASKYRDMQKALLDLMHKLQSYR